MAVIFPRWTNRIPIAIGIGAPIVAITIILGVWYYFSPEFTDVGYQPRQPVSFSHRAHAGGLGLDCRYCHNTVEQAAVAAIPPTATCMNCHSIGAAKGSPRIQLLTQSYENDVPIQWVRVHMLPDYAYFEHGGHLAAGVGCVSCHGRVDEMPIVHQVEPLSMGWCLDCHRDPSEHIRHADISVTDMTWVPGEGRTNVIDGQLLTHRGTEPLAPLHCSGCHR